MSSFLPPARYPLLFVISGPSGVGKDAIIRGLKKLRPSLHFAITATTRPQRPGELDGKDYYFVSRADFERMQKNHELLESASVYGHLYGVPAAQVKDALGRGLDVVVKVDVQGAASIKKMIPEAVFIFVAPHSLQDLRERLGKRETECGTDLDVRLKAFKEEMKSLPSFDYLVLNEKGRLSAAVSSIDAIITAEKCRVKARRIEL